MASLFFMQLLLVLLYVGTAGASRRNAAHSGEDASRKKARYYYSAGMVEQAQGNEDSAYEYFKKAYAADPGYAEAASAFGTRRLSIGLDTLQSDTELARSLSMLRQYVDKYPADVYESQYYGFVAGQLGQSDEAVRVLERAYGLHPESTSILMQLSEVYARAGDLDKAIESIGRYEKAEGLQPQVTTRKLSFLLADKDTVGAIREVSRLVDTDPTSPAYRILKGNVFDIIEMPDSALIYYQEAEMLDPESGAAKLALAGYYQQKGDSVAYDTKMYEVLLCEDLDITQKSDLVAQYLQTLMTDRHDTQRGDYLFSVLHNQYPHEPRVLDLAARYSAAKQDFRDAEEQISYALDLDPTNTVYWGQLMTYQAADDHPEKSIETYERAKKHIEPDENLKMYYASVAQMAKRYDLAAGTYLDMILAIQPGLPTDSLLTLRDVRPDISMGELDMLSRLFTSLGDVYHSGGEAQKAYRAYDNAIVLDQSNSMARNNYAYFLSIGGGDLQKALQLSEQSIAGADSENPTYLDTYAWINYLLGNYEKAEEVQLKAVEVSKKEDYRSAELYDHLGDILARNGRLAEALDAWREAVRIQEEQKDTGEDSYTLTLSKIREAEPKVRALDRNSGKKDSGPAEVKTEEK